MSANPYMQVLSMAPALYRDPISPHVTVTVVPSKTYPDHFWLERSDGFGVDHLRRPIRSDGAPHLLRAWLCPEAPEGWIKFDGSEPPPLRKPAPRKELRHVVYFIGAGPFIKIGYTRDVTRRMIQLCTGCPYPIELLGTISGASGTEAKLHDRFAAHRAHGEWFHRHVEILNFIREPIDAA